MSEIVEKVAMACFASAMREVCPEHAINWEALPAKFKENHRHTARAAIQALRQPTDEMAVAAIRARPQSDSGQVFPCTIWRAMIDEALK